MLGGCRSGWGLGVPEGKLLQSLAWLQVSEDLYQARLSFQKS